jgi:FlaA1/EpsC-like NDP-sugar epimerase
MRSRLWRLARLLVELAIDATIVVAGYYVGLLLRFDGDIPDVTIDTFRLAAPLIVIAYLAANYVFGVYRTAWQYGSLGDVLSLGRSVLLVTAVLFVFNLTREVRHIPLSVNLIAGSITFLGMTFWKMSPRLWRHRAVRPRRGPTRRLLIAGAGNTGQLVAREFLQHADWGYRPVCFADDDPAKRGKRIHRVPVAGATADIPALVARYGVDVVALALPSAPGAKVRELVALCQAARVPVRMVPGLPEIVRSPHQLAQLRDVTVADLIGRDPTPIDVTACRESLCRRVVLITGAAGSIGSELARQVLAFGPAALHLLDNNETGLHDLHQELAQAAGQGAGVDVRLWPADVADAAKVARVCLAARPQVVFHAAAFKHVPLMEEHPDEAFRVNVLGTRNVFRAAAAAGVEKVVFITTDKAVKPVSVYGATKRVGELLVRALTEHGTTVFCAVRFGNVIGSRGSVVSVFSRQIRQGGPVGVTHPEAARYYLTIPEAVSLVLQAAAFAEQGQVLMLDMGEEVRTLDLAEKMIRMNGLAPGADVPIVYTGLRPGEKVREELVAEHEQLLPTPHPRVWRTAGGGRIPVADLDAAVDALAAARDLPRDEFIRRLHALARLTPAGAPEHLAREA